MWDYLSPSSLDVIKLAMQGNYGLAPDRWRAQLEELHALPVVEPKAKP